MVGGSLSAEWLCEAYRRGIFPWPIPAPRGKILAWFSPDPRAILELDQFYVSRRLRRRLRRQEFRVTFDQDFLGVITGCAAPRRSEGGTWITPEMIVAYRRLHELNVAHSVEVWQNDHLVGGLYGVAIGGMFSGESMFHRCRDASKVALVHLVQHLKEREYQLFDIQQSSPHMTAMGATEIRREQFLRRLRRIVDLPVTFG